MVRVIDKGNGRISCEIPVTVSWGCQLTAFYGVNSDEITLLRSFRDNVLRQTPEGKHLIRLYYACNVLITDVLLSDQEFKEVTKNLTDMLLMFYGKAQKDEIE